MIDGIYYVQEGPEGFLIDPDWDGNTFTKDPIHALKRTEPWVAGCSTIMYKCRKIRVSTLDFGGHSEPKLKAFISESDRHFNKIRYYYECPRCKIRTKDYATKEAAKTMWYALSEKCTKQVAVCI